MGDSDAQPLSGLAQAGVPAGTEREHRIEYNPVRLVRQKKENDGRIRILSDKEEMRFRAVVNGDHLLEFEIALHTGMRTSEQYGMTWENVDFGTGIITIPKSKHGETRHVRMNSRVRAILQMMHARSLGTGRVFAVKSPRHWFEPAVAKAGLKDFTWHALRHTFCSRLVAAGVHIRSAQELMGHKTITMTMRYAHFAPDRLNSDVELLCTPAPGATTSATDGFDRAEKIQ